MATEWLAFIGILKREVAIIWQINSCVSTSFREKKNELLICILADLSNPENLNAFLCNFFVIILA